jgi:hypothetical protein
MPAYASMTVKVIELNRVHRRQIQVYRLNFIIVFKVNSLPIMRRLLNYLGHLPAGKIALWCYLIWYLTMASFYFDARLSLWVNSAGISIVIGTALILCVLPEGGLREMEKWSVARLFMMPLCVSSFAALIKDQGFFVVFSPRLMENLAAAGGCAAFVVAALFCKHTFRRG